MSMRVFQKVIDEGGLAAAAWAMDMSPAAVTRLVADREEHLGARLVHRSTRRLSLSLVGEACLARVRSCRTLMRPTGSPTSKPRSWPVSCAC